MCLKRDYPILFVYLLKIHALHLLAHGREGEAFSRTTTVYVLRSCRPWYQTGVHQVWMLIHRSLCTPNIVVQQFHQCIDCTAELSHQHRCPTLSASLSCRITALHLFRFSSFTVATISLGSKNDKFRARANFRGDFSIIFFTLATKNRCIPV